MKTTAAKPMSQIERYILLTFGVLLTAVGVYFFKFPNNFSTGGVSGLSLILGRVFPSPVLTPSAFVFIINMALLVVGFIFLGRSFAFSTVYCSVVLSLAVNVMERFWPLDHPLTNQPLLELCFAVLLPAIGSAILFHLDASSGGTDIVAMIVRKYTSLNIGMALMVADALITLAALFCFGIQSGLFCILGLLMKSVLVDYVTDSFRMKKCFQIITTNPDPIIDFITVNLHRGATLEDVYGAFHHERKTMIITVLTRAQALALRRFIHANDPHAFMVITASTEIVGKGFLASCPFFRLSVPTKKFFFPPSGKKNFFNPNKWINPKFCTNSDNGRAMRAPTTLQEKATANYVAVPVGARIAPPRFVQNPFFAQLLLFSEMIYLAKPTMPNAPGPLCAAMTQPVFTHVRFR